MNKLIVTLLLALSLLSGCGSNSSSDGGSPGGSSPSAPINTPLDDGGIVRGRAEYQVYASNDYAILRFFKDLLPKAYAATGATTVTYTNAASVSFTINVSNFAATGFTGDTLNLGSVALSTIDDNSLKVCGAGSNQKCTQAVIRVYTTGSVSGFVNTADAYGAPVHAGSLNPGSAVGLNTAGAVQVQVVSIAANKNRLKIADFPTPTYNVTSDFSNAGAGNYNMNFVVEYVLF